MHGQPHIRNVSTSFCILALATVSIGLYLYRGADKFLAPTRKETTSEAFQGRARFQQHRDASCHQVFSFLQGKEPKEIHASLTETLACFLPGRAKDLSAPQYIFSSESFNSTYFVKPHSSLGLTKVSLCFCSYKYLLSVECFQILFFIPYMFVQQYVIQHNTCPPEIHRL